jgi:hypothetical protein
MTTARMPVPCQKPESTCPSLSSHRKPVLSELAAASAAAVQSRRRDACGLQARRAIDRAAAMGDAEDNCADAQRIERPHLIAAHAIIVALIDTHAASSHTQTHTHPRPSHTKEFSPTQQHSLVFVCVRDCVFLIQNGTSVASSVRVWPPPGTPAAWETLSQISPNLMWYTTCRASHARDSTALTACVFAVRLGHVRQVGCWRQVVVKGSRSRSLSTGAARRTRETRPDGRATSDGDPTTQHRTHQTPLHSHSHDIYRTVFSYSPEVQGVLTPLTRVERVECMVE